MRIFDPLRGRLMFTAPFPRFHLGLFIFNRFAVYATSRAAFQRTKKKRHPASRVAFFILQNRGKEGQN
jgi:hypothetical protein